MNPESEISYQSTDFLNLTPIQRAPEELFAEQADEIVREDSEFTELQTDQEATAEQKNWLLRHKVGVGVGTLIVGGVAIAAPEVAETVSILKDNAAWAAPSLIATEIMWNTGAGMMLASAGKKIGNPLKIRERMGEIISGVSKSKLFRTGLGVNIAGELGTASIITAGSIAELPPSTWPLTIGSAALLMTPGVGLWVGVHRANKSLEEESK